MLPPDFATRLIADMPDAVVYADASGVIQAWNRGAERIFGWPAAEAIGRSLDLIMPANLHQRHWDGFHKTMKTGESRYSEGQTLSVPALRQDGSRISIDFTIVPFRNPTGAMIGIAAIMRDVTRAFDELRSLRKAIAASQGS